MHTLKENPSLFDDIDIDALENAILNLEDTMAKLPIADQEMYRKSQESIRGSAIWIRPQGM